MFALTVVSLLLSTFAAAVHASSSCIAMDSNFNLLLFNHNGRDYNAGTQDAWSTNTPATDITTSGRPPFNGANTTCFLAQFFNAVYVLSADASNPTAVYIYDATAKSWSMQTVQEPAGSTVFDPTNLKAILDHDTNVIYALSQGEVFFLDMGSLTAANASAVQWMDVGKPSFNTQGYNPVMALAQNHIHFLDVPGLPDGEADIYVIHFSFFQPTPQAYPIVSGPNSGGNFPQQHGQTASFFIAGAVQEEFAYIPDDGSATYVINVQTNTTQQLAAPEKDAGSQYFAGISSLVQLDSQGNLFYLPYNPNSTAANQGASWKSVTNIPSTPASSASGSQSTAASKNPQNNNGGTAAGASPSTTGSSSASAAESSTSVKSLMTALLTVMSFVAMIGLVV